MRKFQCHHVVRPLMAPPSASCKDSEASAVHGWAIEEMLQTGDRIGRGQGNICVHCLRDIRIGRLAIGLRRGGLHDSERLGSTSAKIAGSYAWLDYSWILICLSMVHLSLAGQVRSENMSLVAV